MSFTVKEIDVNRKDGKEVKAVMPVLEFSNRSGHNHTTEFEKVDEALDAGDF